MRLATDFQSASEDDIVTVTFDDMIDGAFGAVIGQKVELDDLEGHTAIGTILDVDDEIIDVEVDFSTWRSTLDQSAGWQPWSTAPTMSWGGDILQVA